MTSAFETAGSWWRCAQYELRGDYICPWPGADVTPYDPWAAFQSKKGKRLDRQPPYESLMLLADTIPRDVSLPLPPDAEKSLLHWCRDHGLLGILMHRTLAVTLWPQWGHRTSWGNISMNDQPHPIINRYVRAPNGWLWNVEHVAGVVSETEAEIGLPVPEELWPSRLAPPTAIVSDLLGLECGEEPLDRTWSSYFPGIDPSEAMTFNYPIPLQDKFWALYAEPVHEFIEVAHVLRDAALTLGQWKDRRFEGKEFKLEVQASAHWLAILSGTVSPVIAARKDGKLTEHWVSTSLLAALAMMAHLDLTGRHRVIRCANLNCGHLFVQAAYQAEYCSLKCREAAQKRRYRARKKEARNGQTWTE